MAEIENGAGRRKSKRTALIKKSTKVDLTPMVDLGFLLITFFVFTTTMAKPKAMGLNMPNDTVPLADLICSSCVLTVFPAQNDSIFYYEGMPAAGTKPKQTTYADIRAIILEKKKMVQSLNDSTKKIVLIIKPLPESSFQNFVDMMDEVAISMVKHYYVDEVNKEDEIILENR